MKSTSFSNFFPPPYNQAAEFFLPSTCIKDPRLTTTRDGIHPVVDFDIARSAVRQRRTMSKFTTGFFVKVQARNENPVARERRG